MKKSNKISRKDTNKAKIENQILNVVKTGTDVSLIKEDNTEEGIL